MIVLCPSLRFESVLRHLCFCLPEFRTVFLEILKKKSKKMQPLQVVTMIRVQRHLQIHLKKDQFSADSMFQTVDLMTGRLVLGSAWL